MPAAAAKLKIIITTRMISTTTNALSLTQEAARLAK
jgi:hypothetical protein